MVCDKCRAADVEKGRAVDGRRAYRCRACGCVWTDGLHGRPRRYNPQIVARGLDAWFADAPLGRRKRKPAPR